jgi:hypothetical protein
MRTLIGILLVATAAVLSMGQARVSIDTGGSGPVNPNQFWGYTLVPPPLGLNGSFYTQTSIFAPGWQIHAVFSAPKTGVLDTFEFWAFVTTKQDIKVSFQDVDPATGRGNGTATYYRVLPAVSQVSNTWHVMGAMTDDGTDSGNFKSVVAGQRVAVVIEFASTAGDISFVGVQAANQMSLTSTYLDRYNGSSWTRSGAQQFSAAIKYHDGTYAQIEGWFPTTGNSGFSLQTQNATAIEYGIVVTFPKDVLVKGFWSQTPNSWGSGAGDGAYVFKLYDTAGVVIVTSGQVNKLNTNSNDTAGTIIVSVPQFKLKANTAYRVVMSVVGTNYLVFNRYVVPTNLLAAHPGGALWVSTYKLYGSTLFVDASQRIPVGLVLDGF